MYESENPNIQKNTIMESRNASFFEHIFPYMTKKMSQDEILRLLKKLIVKISEIKKLRRRRKHLDVVIG